MTSTITINVYIGSGANGAALYDEMLKRAEAEGKTVPAWIKGLINRELKKPETKKVLTNGK